MTRTTLILAVTLAALCTSAEATPPAHQWSAAFGDSDTQEANAVAVDASGNVFVTGRLAGSADFGGGVLTATGFQDIFLAKFDAAGNHLWSQVFGDSSYQSGYAAAVDGSGNVVITGNVSGGADFGGGPLSTGDFDVFVAKFDAAGNHIWSGLYGDGTSFDLGRSIAGDAAGNTVVTGTYSGTIDFGGGTLTSGGGPTNIFMAKFDPAGNHLWSGSFGDSSGGGGYGVAIDGSGDVLLTGWFSDAVDFGGGVLTGAGGADIFLAKFDAAGNHIWSQRFGDDGVDAGESVATDPSGNVVLTGTFEGGISLGGALFESAGSLDFFLAKFDATGAHLWSRRFGNPNYHDAPNAAVDVTGNVFIAGEFTGDIDFGGGILTSVAWHDVFLAKYNPAGDHLWSRRFGDANQQFGRGVAVDPLNSVVLAGGFVGTVDFGGGGLTNPSARDIFVASFDAGEQFNDGDLFLLSRNLPAVTPYEGIVRIDPNTGAVSQLYESETTVNPWFTYDPFRELLVFSQSDSGLVGVDAGGNLTVIVPVAGLAGPSQVAARSDGIIYLYFNSPNEFGYVDAGDVVHDLLDIPGTGTFGFPSGAVIQDIIYDPATNSLIALTGLGVFPECPTSGETCAVKLPLSAAGTQVVGPVTSVSADIVAGVESIAGSSRYKNPGEILIFLFKNTAPGYDLIQRLDVSAMTLSTFATPAFAGDNVIRGGTYSTVLDKAVINDTFHSIVRCYALADSGVGDTLAVGTSASGYGEPARMVEIPMSIITGVGASPRPAPDARLLLPYPNPFNPSTTIRFELGKPGHARLDIYDVRGRRVRTLLDRNMGPGVHRVLWDGRDGRGGGVASGVYFIHLRVGSTTGTGRMVLIR